MKKLLLIALILPLVGFNQNSDAVLWTGAAVELDITKDLSAEFESQSRFDQNMSRMIQTYGELGAGYDIVKGLKAGIVYRYSRKNDGDFYFNENRFCLDLRYRYKLEMGLSLKTRVRYQHSFDRFSVINGVYPRRKNIFRYTFGLGYKNADFKLIQPFLAAEFFNAIQPKNTTSSLDTYRVKFGFNLDLPKRHAVKVFYMFEHENRSVDNNYHIYCVQYNYALRPLHKKKSGKAPPPTE